MHVGCFLPINKSSDGLEDYLKVYSWLSPIDGLRINISSSLLHEVKKKTRFLSWRGHWTSPAWKRGDKKRNSGLKKRLKIEVTESPKCESMILFPKTPFPWDFTETHQNHTRKNHRPRGKRRFCFVEINPHLKDCPLKCTKYLNWKMLQNEQPCVIMFSPVISPRCVCMFFECCCRWICWSLCWLSAYS